MVGFNILEGKAPLPMKTVGRLVILVDSCSFAETARRMLCPSPASRIQSLTSATRKAEMMRRNLLVLFDDDIRVLPDDLRETPPGRESSDGVIWPPLPNVAAKAVTWVSEIRARFGMRTPSIAAFECVSSHTANNPHPCPSLASSSRGANASYGMVGAVIVARDRAAAAAVIARKIADDGQADCRPTLLIRLTAPFQEERGAFHEYATFLLRVIDGVLAALRLALVRLRSAMARRPRPPAFLRILLAVARHYGRGSEPAPWAFPFLALHPLIQTLRSDPPGDVTVDAT